MDYHIVPLKSTGHPLSNRKYDYRQATGINKLITTEFVKSLKLKPEQLDQKYKRGIRVQSQFVRKIFHQGIKELLLHCIETNKKFVSPTLPRFNIYITEKPYPEFKSIIERPKIYYDLDLFKSDFKIYEFVLSSRETRFRINKIRIGYTMYKQMQTRINMGMKYQNLGLFSTRVIMDKLQVIYPTIERSLIRKILEEGFFEMHYYLRKGDEIWMKSIPQFLQFIVYHNLKPCK